MQFIISVLDYLWFNRYEYLRKHINALIELKRWVNKEVINKRYEMYKIKDFSKNMNRNSKQLHFRHFYNLSHIIRNVHLVSINQKCTRYYVNNFIIEINTTLYMIFSLRQIKFKLRTSKRNNIKNKMKFKDVIVKLKYKLKKITLNIDIKIITQSLFKYTNISHHCLMFN